MKKILVLLLVLLLVVLFFSDCQTEKKETFKIGAILPLSGERANYGKSAKEGFELAIEEINSENSKKELILNIEDSKGLPKEAVNAYLQLTSTYETPIIFGLLSSSEVLSVAPLAEKNKIIIFSSGASSPLISTAGDYIFRDVPSDLLEATLMAETAYKELNFRKIGIIFINNDYGQGVLKKFSEKFKDLGGEVIIDVTYNANQTDFKTQLFKIKEAIPDGIYFIGYKELGKLVKQAKELNIEAQYLSNALFEDPEVLKIAGKSAEGLIFSTFYFDVDSKEPRTSSFVNSYKNKYDKIPDGFAVAAYDAVHVVFKALGDKPITADNIKNSLYNLDSFDGLLGVFRFDKNGDVILPVKLKTVKNNKFINY